MEVREHSNQNVWAVIFQENGPKDDYFQTGCGAASFYCLLYSKVVAS